MARNDHCAGKRDDGRRLNAWACDARCWGAALVAAAAFAATACGSADDRRPPIAPTPTNAPAEASPDASPMTAPATTPEIAAATLPAVVADCSELLPGEKRWNTEEGDPLQVLSNASYACIDDQPVTGERLHKFIGALGNKVDPDPRRIKCRAGFPRVNIFARGGEYIRLNFCRNWWDPKVVYVGTAGIVVADPDRIEGWLLDPATLTD